MVQQSTHTHTPTHTHKHSHTHTPPTHHHTHTQTHPHVCSCQHPDDSPSRAHIPGSKNSPGSTHMHPAASTLARIRILVSLRAYAAPKNEYTCHNSDPNTSKAQIVPMRLRILKSLAVLRFTVHKHGYTHARIRIEVPIEHQHTPFMP